VTTWRRSSYSGQDGLCVEVRRDLGALRDSKNPTGPVLPSHAADEPVRALVRYVRRS
jgi:hypothetical protein